jgi:pyrimidine-specific ribonucleoside hydrolase
VIRRVSIGLFVSMVLFSGCAGGTSTRRAAPPATTAVVVDTDMGWDDIGALVYLLRRPDVDIRAITVSGTGLTHCAAGVRHVRQLVAYLGHATVPVACGRQQPLAGSEAFPMAWRQAADDFFRLTLPAVSSSGSNDTAVQVLQRALLSSPATTVISLAPMTNLADTLTRYPNLRQRIRTIYAMGGALDVPGNEVVNGRAEYNVFIDARAADVVLRSGAPITLVPLDAADDVPVTVFFHDALAVHEQPGASEVVSMLLDDPYYYGGSQYFWDPVTAAIAGASSIASFKTEPVDVVLRPGLDHGRTIQAAGGVPIRVALNVNARAFYEQYLRVLTGQTTVAFNTPPGGLDVAYTAGRWTVGGRVQPANGPMALRVTNNSASPVGVGVGQLAAGHTVSEVDAAIHAKVTSVPTWFHTVLLVTVPRGHPATWGVKLRTGLYVAIGGGPNLPLQRLGVVSVPNQQ